MIKVVWFSSLEFSVNPIKRTGTWLQPLAEELVKTKKVELYNITRNNKRKNLTSQCFNNIKQWVFPECTQTSKLKASISVCKQVKKILDEIHPDIVHVWGTESSWLSVYTQGYIKYPCFCDIQGLKSAYIPFYFGGLTFKEILCSSWGYFELLNPRKSLPLKFLHWKNLGKIEISRLSHLKYISVQSQWTEIQLTSFLPNAKFVHTGIILREEFYKAKQWETHNHTSPRLFSSAYGLDLPYKGLLTLLKSLLIIKNFYSEVHLNLAGPSLANIKQKNGYTKLIDKFIKENNLHSNITFLDALTAEEIIVQLQNCDVCIVPSYVETYCLAFAESMILGTPTIATYSGALPELAECNQEAAFYNANDYRMLAIQTIKIFEDKEFAQNLSSRSRARRGFFCLATDML